MRMLATLCGVLAFVFAASALTPSAPVASAQSPAQQPGSGPAQAAPATPAPAALGVRISGGRYSGRSLFALVRQRMLVEGTLNPFVAGESVTVRLLRAGRVVQQVTVQVHAKGTTGAFKVALRAARAGNYKVDAIHAADARQAAASARPAAFGALAGHASRGSGGVAVRLLQRALRGLGYVTSTGGRYDEATALAVLAFRKVNRMARTESANERVFSELFRGAGGFRLRYPGAGRHVEFDFSRQVLVLADHGRAQAIYHASSGKPSTPTVFGSFRFYWQQPGTNDKGMFDSSYFISGYAIHGYPQVPNYPASHGCIRVPMSDAVSIYNSVHLGEQIFVYR